MIKRVRTEELQLGDVIKCLDGPWGTAIVQNIVGDDVELFRPYGRHDDFSYTGGVICYIGVEHFAISRTNGLIYELYQRSELK